MHNRRALLKTIGLVSLLTLIPQVSSAIVLTVDDTVNVSAVVPASTPVTPPGGTTPTHNSGSILSIPASQQGVSFSGYAYPGSTVYVWKGTTLITTQVADARGYFTVFVTGNSPSLYSMLAIAPDGSASILFNFPVVAVPGAITTLDNIIFAPTIMTSGASVASGGYVTVRGTALPNRTLEIRIQSVIDPAYSRTFTVTTEKNGSYTLTMPVQLAPGDYTLRTSIVGQASSSRSVPLTVRANLAITPATTATGTKTTPTLFADLNHDGKVNILDLSILEYWYHRTPVPASVDLNHDGKVDFKDFSIMSYYWTH